MSIITKTNDIGKYFLIIRSKKNTLFSSEYFFSFILLPLRYFFYLNQKGTLYNFKSKYQFPCFCVFFTLFFRRCKYYCVYLSDLYFCFDYPPQVSLLQHVWFVCFCSKSLILKHIMCIFSFSNLNNLSCGNHFLQQTSTSGLTNSQYSLNLFSAD